MITNYEQQYIAALKDIYNNGYDDGVNERTGISTKRLPNISIRVDLSKEFPILKSKQVFSKTAEREILWIWQQMSNNIHDLKAKIWDEWADANGSIGTAYGAQIAKPVCIYTDPIHKTPESFRAYKSQTEFVLEYLREFPNGRWANVSLWNVDDLYGMNLVPCCHTVTWNLDGNRLNCLLDQRSGDMPYGVPFNTSQYAMLTCMFARDLGVKPGVFLHVIADAHIYANQMQGVERQLRLYNLLTSPLDPDVIYPLKSDDILSKYAKGGIVEAFDTDDLSLIRKITMEANNCVPQFTIDENVTSFWDMTVENAKITDYHFMDRVDFGDVAV